jgi:hypothetical protein
MKFFPGEEIKFYTLHLQAPKIGGENVVTSFMYDI